MDEDAYYRAIRRSNIGPEYGRIRQHSFGIGIAVLWAAYLAGIAYGLLRLYGFIAHRIP